MRSSRDVESGNFAEEKQSASPETISNVGFIPETISNVGSIPKHVPWATWAILFISSFGVFMASVSTSALIIAFPVLLKELRMTINTMMWVLLVLLLIIGAVVPVAGKLGDIIGQARVYKIGYWLFVIGSLGAGFVNASNNGSDLVAARVVIGFGAALLFTNSAAILTNAFAPYQKVGLSQGVFQLCAAMGIVLGPLLGGAFATSSWRWIFWFNVPPGGLCALIATFILEDDAKRVHRSFSEHIQRFDFLGTASSSLGLILILIAMVQGVVADPVLSQTGSLIGLVVAGCVSGIIFIVDQFHATDPLIPPSIFRNRTFTLTTICGTLMAFVRNSITYNMIFFLQGPLARDPLQAGIDLIPYGVGNMVAGFGAGALSDRVGIRTMTVAGPLITLTGTACLSAMDQATSAAYVGGILFLTGFGVGTFQSPNGAANMLSVDPARRGVAAAIGMLTMTFCMMVGIVLTFSLVLHSMTSEQLFDVFINGGAPAPHPVGNSTGGNSTSKAGGLPVRACLDALAADYYVLIAACAIAAGTALFHAPGPPSPPRDGASGAAAAPANSDAAAAADKAAAAADGLPPGGGGGGRCGAEAANFSAAADSEATAELVHSAWAADAANCEQAGHARSHCAAGDCAAAVDSGGGANGASNDGCAANGGGSTGAPDAHLWSGQA